MDVITKYIHNSKMNLINIIKYLDNNIEFVGNELWKENIDDELLNGIINIYYDNYYLNKNVNYEKIKKYVNINDNINEKLKKVLLSIISYYEKINETNIIKQQEEVILYLDILIYLGIKIYNADFKLIDEPKKIEKIINNIIDNFAKIRFKKDKNLEKLIFNLKDIVVYNNYFNKTLNKLNKSNSFNKFIKINKNSNYYKTIYDYKIDELNKYDVKDISIVNNELNLKEEISKISFDLVYFTNFKALNSNKKYNYLFPITKKELINNYDYFVNNRNEKIIDNIKFVINFDELENDYNFINIVREKNIDLYIEVNNIFETNNYNLFMDVKNIIVPEDFISRNEKYKEIWKDMDINFLIKNIDSEILLENDLLRKKEV